MQALEARTAQTSRDTDLARKSASTSITVLTREKATLIEANRKFRAENADLRDEAEELRAMVEVLKNQVGGPRGLFSEARASPVLSI